MSSMRRLGLPPILATACAIVVAAVALAGNKTVSGPASVPSGSEAPPGVELPPEMSGPQISEETWRYPLGYDASTVETVGESDAPFELVLPSDSDHSSILVGADREASLFTLGWVFRRPRGEMVLEERIGIESQDELEAQAPQNPGCAVTPGPSEETQTHCEPGGIALVTLNSGSNALLVQGEGITTLTWLLPLRPASPDSLAEVDTSGAVLELQLLAEGAAPVDNLLRMANDMKSSSST
jgi:hypothetical protein